MTPAALQWVEEKARKQSQRPHVPRLRESPRDRHIQAGGLEMVSNSAKQEAQTTLVRRRSGAEEVLKQ